MRQRTKLDTKIGLKYEIRDEVIRSEFGDTTPQNYILKNLKQSQIQTPITLSAEESEGQGPPFFVNKLSNRVASNN